MCMPCEQFHVVQVDKGPDERAFNEEIVPGMGDKWAYRGPVSPDQPDSWLLLCKLRATSLSRTAVHPSI